MTHPGSGNPTWRDYPDTSTLVTAASLERIEDALDAVVASVLDRAPRTVPWCEARLMVNASTAATTDLFAQTNWAVPTGGDPFSMAKLSTTGGTLSYLQAPAGWAGRYLIRYHATTSGMGSGGTHVASITRNAANPANSIGRALNTMGAAGSDGAVVDAFAEVTLSETDRVYWANWTSVATTIPAVPSGLAVPTAIFARYLGPA